MIALKRTIALALVISLPLAGCSDMTPTERRAVTGVGIGAAGGAVLGAIAGNAGLGAGLGAAAGLAGGLLYDHAKKAQASSYRAGYAAGANSAPPPPPPPPGS